MFGVNGVYRLDWDNIVCMYGCLYVIHVACETARRRPAIIPGRASTALRLNSTKPHGKRFFVLLRWAPAVKKLHLEKNRLYIGTNNKNLS